MLLNGGSHCRQTKGANGKSLLGRDHWVLARTPRPKMVGFCDLAGVAIAPVSKKLAVKSMGDHRKIVKKQLERSLVKLKLLH